MRLYVSGVKVPKLGSPQDVALRTFMLRESEKALKINQLLAHIAISNAGRDKKRQENISSLWSAYVNLELGMKPEEVVQSDQEKEMIAEYESIRHLRPKMKRDRTGKIYVEGLNF